MLKVKSDPTICTDKIVSTSNLATGAKTTTELDLLERFSLGVKQGDIPLDGDNQYLYPQWQP